MPRSFNGTSDTIVADAAASFSQVAAYSVAMWVNGPTSASEREFYSEASSISVKPVIALASFSSFSTATIVVRDDVGASNKINTQTSATVLDNTWHHIGYADDGSGNWNMYVDGAADISGTFTPGTTTINRLTIGCLRWNGTTIDFFNGKVAHVAKWARKLSAAEFKSLANGLLPPFLGPTHYWPLWGADSPEPDLVSAGVDGTLTGTTGVAAGPKVTLSLLGLS